MKRVSDFFRDLKQVLGIASLLLVAFLTGCSDDNDVVETPQDIVDVAVANGYNVLAAALTEADLITTLKGSGPFTVFAPTDAAFAAAGITAANVGDIPTADLTSILTYHVVSGNITSGDLVTGNVNSIEGSALSINATDLTVNDANIINPFDVEASNGVIHTIDQVLMLPVDEVPGPTQNIVQLAQSVDDLSILVEALTLFPDLVSALSDANGTYTVFAPTNASFISLLEALGKEELADIPESVIERILTYHVVAGTAAASGDLSDGDQIATLLSADDQVTVSKGDAVAINGANVIIADNLATNGIVHIVDEVLIPSLELSIVNTVVEAAYFSTDFTTLTGAVVKAGLLNTLIDREANLTVFAPTNDAFEAIGITSLDNLSADDLAPILQYHVLSSEVKAADLPVTGSAVTTLNGDFYLSINTNGVYINGISEVVATDIDQGNGVVHVIDRTLQPASSNIVEIAIAASTATEGAEFTQLVAALTAVSDNTETDLVTALQGDGPFTVFAPTDAAFQTLYDAVGDQDNDGDADITDLVSAAGGLDVIATVLQYHVYAGRVFSTDIPNVLAGNASVNLSPLAGGSWDLNDDLTITPTDAVLTIGLDDAQIITSSINIRGTNGVIHAIDQVILP